MNSPITMGDLFICLMAWLVICTVIMISLVLQYPDIGKEGYIEKLKIAMLVGTPATAFIIMCAIIGSR